MPMEVLTRHFEELKAKKAYLNPRIGTKVNAAGGIKSVIKNAPNAPVEDKTT